MQPGMPLQQPLPNYANQDFTSGGMGDGAGGSLGTAGGPGPNIADAMAAGYAKA